MDPRRLAFAMAVAAAGVVAAGVLLGGWSPFVVVGLYWLENVAIGAFTVARMLAAGLAGGQLIGAVGLAAFFTVHYGMFCAIHGVFVVALFAGPLLDQRTELVGVLSAPLPLVLGTLLAEPWGWLALAAIVAPLAVQTMRWIAARFAKRDGLEAGANLMTSVYGRIVVLHLVLIGGGLLIAWTGAPTAGVLLLVAIKLVFDLVSARRAD